MGPKTNRYVISREDESMGKGNIPQWIAVTLLTLIGALVFIVYTGVTSRVDRLELRHADAMEKLIEIKVKVDKIEKTLNGREK